MKNILCYGDSNTFGFNPNDCSQFDESTRWTSLLQKKIGSKYNVINEGLPNRTGFSDNPEGVLYSAQKHLPLLLSTSADIDLLILAIGTNDLQFQYNISHSAIEKGLENLIKISKEKTYNIIIISPTKLNNNILNGYFACMFDEKSIEKSNDVGEIYRRVSDANACIFFDINKFVTPSDIDGLHYDEISHKIIADKLYEVVSTILSIPQ